jgi:peptidyl-prolyl cis-trans isomerase B (cyclophilin B)
VTWIVVATVNKPGSAAAGSSSCLWTPRPNPPAAPTVTPSAGSKATPSPTPSIGIPPNDVPRSGYQVITYNTNRGVIKVEMDLSRTPCTSASMANLVQAKFYDGTSCHRLVPSIYALQCGDPTGTGTGGPGYQFGDENLPKDKLPAYHAGDVAMANSGADTNGSQFFFVWNASNLPGDYTLWGHVLEGLDIVKAIGAGGDDGSDAQDPNSQGAGGHPKLKLTFTSVTISAVSPTSQVKPTTPPPAPSTGPSAAPSTSPSH